MAMAVSQVHAGVDGMSIAARETAELIEHLKPGRAHYFEQMLFPRVLSGDADAQRAFVARLFDSLGEGKRGGEKRAEDEWKSPHGAVGRFLRKRASKAAWMRAWRLARRSESSAQPRMRAMSPARAML